MDNTIASAPPQSTVQSRSRRWLVVAAQVVAILIAAYGIFRFGMLWSLRGFALPQPSPNPFLANFPRYAIAALWPLPGALLLFVAAGRFGRRRPRWWILALAAGLWFAAYLLVRPAEVYYYWLMPTS